MKREIVKKISGRVNTKQTKNFKRGMKLCRRYHCPILNKDDIGFTDFIMVRISSTMIYKRLN